MEYELIYSKDAVNKLEKLDHETKIRIIRNLERIRIRPESFVTKLVGVPYYKLRVGDYRVILDIDKGKLVILVITMGNRSRIYKSVK